MRAAADVLSCVGLVILVVGPVVTATSTIGDFFATCAFGAFAISVSCAMVGAWYPAASFGACAAVMAWLWWRNRRDGRWKRAIREVGAKSRARVQALVEQMSPSPVGARYVAAGGPSDE